MKKIEVIDVVDMQAILGRMTFPPGWRIEVRKVRDDPEWLAAHGDDDGDLLLLHVTQQLVDARPPHEVRPLFMVKPLPEFVLDAEHFVAWVLRVCEERVVHEIREWVRIDGELVVDPHANDRVPA